MKKLRDFYCVCGKGHDAVPERPCTILTWCPRCKNRIVATIDENDTKTVWVPALGVRVAAAADEKYLPKW